ncbi:hypothetical protein GCM10010274_21670 [Streptomyces lavendofoliae]|uniref:Uncharacterized protein n=1 Tax=Streptomyces lavendofoliae TaxID=67314 RepID=A0A918M3I9_9ACTN|nr:hypothetical protein GCM10010274_21670 [Streptomyces lavendofoliae]
METEVVTEVAGAALAGSARAAEHATPIEVARKARMGRSSAARTHPARRETDGPSVRPVDPVTGTADPARPARVPWRA